MTWEIRDGIVRSHSRFFSHSRSDFATRMKVRDHLCLSRVNCRGVSLLQFSCLVKLPAFSEMLAKVALFFSLEQIGKLDADTTLKRFCRRSLDDDRV